MIFIYENFINITRQFVKYTSEKQLIFIDQITDEILHNFFDEVKPKLLDQRAIQLRYEQLKFIKIEQKDKVAIDRIKFNEKSIINILKFSKINNRDTVVTWYLRNNWRKYNNFNLFDQRIYLDLIANSSIGMKKTNDFRKNIISNLIKKSVLTAFEKKVNPVKNEKVNKRNKNNEHILIANKSQDIVLSSPSKLDNSLDQRLSQKFDELFVLNHNKINHQNFNLLINDMIKDIFKTNPMEKQIFTLKYLKNCTDTQVIDNLKIDLSILNDSKVKLQNWFNDLVNSAQLKTVLLKLLKIKNIATIDFVKFKTDFNILADIYKTLDQLNDFKLYFAYVEKTNQLLFVNNEKSIYLLFFVHKILNINENILYLEDLLIDQQTVLKPLAMNLTSLMKQLGYNVYKTFFFNEKVNKKELIKGLIYNQVKISIQDLFKKIKQLIVFLTKNNYANLAKTLSSFKINDLWNDKSFVWIDPTTVSLNVNVEGLKSILLKIDDFISNFEKLQLTETDLIQFNKLNFAKENYHYIKLFSIAKNYLEYKYDFIHQNQKIIIKKNNLEKINNLLQLSQSLLSLKAYNINELQEKYQLQHSWIDKVDFLIKEKNYLWNQNTIDYTYINENLEKFHSLLLTFTNNEFTTFHEIYRLVLENFKPFLIDNALLDYPFACFKILKPILVKLKFQVDTTYLIKRNCFANYQQLVINTIISKKFNRWTTVQDYFINNHHIAINEIESVKLKLVKTNKICFINNDEFCLASQFKVDNNILQYVNNVIENALLRNSFLILNSINYTHNFKNYHYVKNIYFLASIINLKLTNFKIIYNSTLTKQAKKFILIVNKKSKITSKNDIINLFENKKQYSNDFQLIVKQFNEEHFN